MGDYVGYVVADGVATLLMDNPPVNALGQGLRLALQDAFAKAEADTAIGAIVLSAAGRGWPAGADIREFGKPAVSPVLPDLCAQIAQATKPVIATMTGHALGGGLELALCAALRLAAPTTVFGFPEIRLGLLPGAGGTQRLPRLIGAAAALNLMLTGAPITAAAALKLGLAVPAGCKPAQTNRFQRSRCLSCGRWCRARDAKERCAARASQPRLGQPQPRRQTYHRLRRGCILVAPDRGSSV
jgi:enoyl-CoA hydratase/carnithine racemase